MIAPTGSTDARAVPEDGPSLARWLAGRGQPLQVSPAAAPPRLPDAVRGADIVGVAMGLRTGRESLLAGYAIAQALIDAGFRAVSLEGTTDTGSRLDDWLATGRGDPRALLTASQAFLPSAETLAFLRRLRSHNLHHPEAPIALVHGDPGGRPASLAQVETQLARRDLHWRERTGQRIVHVGGVAHLLAGRQRTVEPAGITGPNAATLIAEACTYACVAVTIGASPGPPAVPVPPAHYVEHALNGPPPGPRLVDLSTATATGDLPPSAGRWLARPLVTRCVGPDYDPDHDGNHHVRTGPIATAVAAMAHLPTATSATPLPR